jgi:hypothetical protein
MSNKYTIVTSFPVKSWDVYGERFLNSFIEYWPKDIQLLCYCDGYPLPDNAPKADNIHYFDLLDNDRLIEFKERNKQFDGKAGKNTYSFYQDAVKFSHKVYAQHMAMNYLLDRDGGNAQWLIWLDADSVTYEPITEELLSQTFNDEADIVYLGRKNAYATCSSLIGYNINPGIVEVFMTDYVNYYNSDEVLKLQCFADNYVFDRLRILHEAHGMVTHDLTPNCEGLDAFDLSPLGNHIVHLKGNKKYGSGNNPNFKARRYVDLCAMVKHYKRKNILEIGTWNGDTACAMIQSAFEANDTVHYTGIDLFEDATDETDKEEFNVKKHYTKKSVELKLTDLAKEYAKINKTLTFYLMKGDSKSKLSILNDPSIYNMYNVKPDFVFIDGGHSTETVRSDYELCKNIPVIVLDDYYTEDEQGKMPTEFLGVNDIYKELGGTDRTGEQRRFIISTGDRVAGGGHVNLAVVLNDLSLPNPPDTHKVPVQVNPRDCVPPDNIQNNVRENMKLFNDNMVQRCHWHHGKLVLASAGPSLVKNLDKIKELQKHGAKVFCVKHSHNTLIENGIIPWGCVILDPRPFDGTSTHGIVRRELLADPHPKVKYFVASMTNIDVTKYLVEKGANIIGWHAYTNALIDMQELQDQELITGGTCSAMRTIGIGHTLGFREFHIFGMDCCHEGVPEDLDEVDMYGKKKWIKIGILNPKTKEEDIFYTTGELLALSQDFEALLNRENEVDMDIFVYGEGVAPSLFRGSNYTIKPDFKSLYGE